jgi:hypothetical protein
MPRAEVHLCQCLHGQPEAAHPDRVLQQHMNVLLSRLNEQQRRWYAAVEATRLGRGGDQLVAQITGLDPKTIQRGRQERAEALAKCPTERVRLPGAGRPRVEQKRPSSNPNGWSSSHRKRPAIRWAPGNGCAVVCAS